MLYFKTQNVLSTITRHLSNKMDSMEKHWVQFENYLVLCTAWEVAKDEMEDPEMSSN